MFVQTWNKYLPVIRILFKRSMNGEQTLDMNKSDFQRAAGGKKVKLTFSIRVAKGRLNTIDNPSPLARDFVAALQSDDITNRFIRNNEIELSLNSGFQLHIKNVTPPAVPELQATEETDHTEEGNPDAE